MIFQLENGDHVVSSVAYNKFEFGLAEWVLSALRSKNSLVPKIVLWSVCTVCAPREKPFCRRAWNLRTYFCPPIFWVTVGVEATDAECLWCPESTFPLEGLCPVTLTGDSCEVFERNSAGLKGQWWKMTSAVFSFPGHRFFSVAWTNLPVTGWHVLHGACCSSLRFCHFRHWEEVLK